MILIGIGAELLLAVFLTKDEMGADEAFSITILPLPGVDTHWRSPNKDV